jgi:hypothetical protein
VYDAMMAEQLSAAAEKAPADADALQKLLLGNDTWAVG